VVNAPGSLPGWAVAVIVVGAVLFVSLALLAIAGPRRLGRCLLGEVPGPAPSEYGGSEAGGRLPSKGGASARNLLTVLLPGAGRGSGSVGGEAEAVALEEGALLPPVTRGASKTVRCLGRVWLGGRAVSGDPSSSVH